MLRKVVSSALLLFAVATACTNLPALQLGTSGNDVVEPPEDCDTYGNATGPGGKCITSGADACHFACDPAETDSTSADACPSGFACSANGVCRRPNGAFDTTPTSVGGTPTLRVLTGDFDGDHVADVVSVSATSFVHYFDGRAEASRVPLSSVSAIPALGSLGDPTTDPRTSAVIVTKFALPGNQGQTPSGNVRVWRGGTDRTLIPTVYPALDLTNQTQGLGNKLTDGRVLAAFRQGDPGSEIYAIVNPTGVYDLDFIIGPGAQSQGAPQTLFQDVGKPSDIAGQVPVGALGVPTVCPPPLPAVVRCQNFVVARQGQSVAYVYPTCNGNGDPNVLDGNHVAAIPLDLPGDVIDGPAFLAAPPNAAPQPPSVFVVGKQSLWQFTGTPCGIDTTGVPTPLPISAPDKLLAVGYIDQLDTCLDWVSSFAITTRARSNPAASTCDQMQVSAAPVPWTDARIGDFNGNGRPDVVAISSTSLDFYNGSGTLLLNGQHTVVDGRPENLAVGDFDGDYVSDFAFDTTGDSTGLTSANIQMAFGQLSGFPIAPRSVGRLDGLLELAPAFFDYLLAGKYDFIESIFAIEQDPMDKHLVTSLLEGSPDRLINSPYFLDPQQMQAITSSVVANLAGNAHPGIAGLSIGQQTQAPGLWFVPATGEAQLDVTRTAVTTLTGVDASRADGIHVAPIDLGGATGQTLAVLQPASPDGSSQSCFFLASVTDTTWNVPPCEKGTDVRAFGSERDFMLDARDVDGDGDTDLVVGYASDDKSTFAARVLVNAHDGTPLTLAGGTVLPVPPGTIALTTIHFAQEGGTQFLALTPTGLWIAPTLGAAFQRVLTFAEDGGASLASGEVPTDLAVADVDGDGVDDAVVGTNQGFKIYYGVPQP